MNRFTMWSVALGLLLLTVLVAGCRETAAPVGETPQPKPAPTQPPAGEPAASAEGVGQKAPDFAVTDVDGTSRSLKDYAGKVLVVDFWATYCKPCIEHLQDYNTAYDELTRQGADFLALSMDESDAVIRGWRPKGFDIPLARLDDKTHQAFFGKLEIVPIPQVRIIDRKGVLRASLGPDATSEQVLENVKALLEEK